jgi:undecaprenyl diphosphate synthase
MRRRLPRSAGHRAGGKAVNVVVEAAAQHGVGTLTLYAFSAANWQRPAAEVGALFQLFRRHLLTETRRCLEQSIRLEVIGRRDRFEPSLLQLIERSEEATAACAGMTLRLAIDYSSQHSLLEACRRLKGETAIDRAQFVRQLAEADHAAAPAPDVDLLIRTGGEKRLSDFLLWECAYAELYFTDCLWPDFDAQAFAEALAEYGRRDRRFGRIGEAAPARSSRG